MVYLPENCCNAHSYEPKKDVGLRYAPPNLQKSSIFGR